MREQAKRFSIFFLLVFALIGRGATAAAALSNKGDGAGLSYAISDRGGYLFAFYNEEQKSLIFAEEAPGGTQEEVVDGPLSRIPTFAVKDSAPRNSTTSLVLLNGVPQIFYLNGEQQLMHAYRTDAGWSKEAVTEAVVNGSPAAAVCGTEICVTFQEQSGKTLQLARGETGRWTVTTVDAEGDVGLMSDVAADSAGNAHVAYYDATNRIPKVAHEHEGRFSSSKIEFVGRRFGLYPSIAVGTDDAVHITAAEDQLTDTGPALSTYYVRCALNDLCTPSLLSSNYSGGATAVTVGADNLPVAATRLSPNNPEGKGGVRYSKLDQSGYWITQTLPAGDSAHDSASAEDIRVKVDQAGRGSVAFRVKDGANSGLKLYQGQG